MLNPDNDRVVFDTVAIIGVGLIGGSLGMAAKRRGLVRRVVGIGRTEQKLMQAKILDAIDDYTMDLAAGVSEADLVVICTPVRMVVPTLQSIASFLKPGAIVTDVGSTKQEIVEGAEEITPECCHFIGGHPMAGSEQGGVEHAQSDLFLDATYVITNSPAVDIESLGKLTALAEGIGSRVEIMSPADHDASVAIISHLPHAMAGALLLTAETAHRKSHVTFNLAAGSFRDLTRIAGSSPELWRDICITNRDSLCNAISSFQTYLDEFKTALADGDEAKITRFFEQSNEIRQAFLRMKNE